jgi:fatty-acyl-CoA synthase
MAGFQSLADIRAIEAEKPYPARGLAATMHSFLGAARSAHGSRPAISFQIFSGPTDKARTLTWNALFAQVTQAANLFRKLGVGPSDTVAFILPNALETVVTLLGGMVAGVVAPVNPLLEPDQISAILRETRARVVVTLKPFPKTDIAQKVAEAVRHAPSVTHVLELDLVPCLSGLKRWIAPFIRPRNPIRHHAQVLDFARDLAAMNGDRLDFPDPAQDRVGAYFHTGGTTGMPKVAQHRLSGMIYNGWIGHRLLFRETDNLLCPLPMFHVFAAYPVLMSVIAAGAHVVFPTPAGYRGDGVVDNLWKLIERWKITYLIAVPTALSALMQRPVNADISTLRGTFSGSAPLPVELYKRFEAATGVQVVEGYGLTEVTCLVSVNPPDGVKKIGSVGIPFPYTSVRILTTDGSGEVRECGMDDVGEICVSSPGVSVGATYTEAEKNRDLYWGQHLRTGDLGRLDEGGYLFITGRAKDLIIRGGHNIDPAVIEAALMSHPAVAFAGAVGQPDAHAGELPCVYVELIGGAAVTTEALLAHARAHIPERAAHPKHLEILDELPKTAVGKVRKPDLRIRAITRVLNEALGAAKLDARVVLVEEDRKRGLVARVDRRGSNETPVRACLGQFAVVWDWAAAPSGNSLT